MRIGELTRRSGLSADTLRYYEKIGLIPPIDRRSGGRRDYDPAILVWIAFLQRLKATEMPLAEMVRYAQLREKGNSTARDRRELLEKHRGLVAARLKELQSCLDVIEGKIAGYAELEKDLNP